MSFVRLTQQKGRKSWNLNRGHILSQSQGHNLRTCVRNFGTPLHTMVVKEVYIYSSLSCNLLHCTMYIWKLSLRLLKTRDMGSTSSCCWSWLETSTNYCWQCRRDCPEPGSNIVLGWKRFANAHNLIFFSRFLFCYLNGLFFI